MMKDMRITQPRRNRDASQMSRADAVWERSKFVSKNNYVIIKL